MNKKILLISLILLISSLSVLAVNLSDYPKFLDKGKNTKITIVKGSGQSSIHAIAALDVLSTLPREWYKTNIFSKLDSDGDIDPNSDFILIGGPCNNKITKRFVENPDDCAQGATPGNSIIKVVGDKQIVVMLFAATDADYRTLGKTLATQKFPKADKVIVAGDSIKEAPKEEPKKEPVKVVVAPPKEEPKKEFTDRAAEVAKGVCDGCVTENGCLSLGDLTSISGKSHYCSENKELKMQQDINGSCTQNIECVTSYCNSGTCQEKSWLHKFWIWLKNLF